MKRTNETRKKHLSDGQEMFKKFLKIEEEDALWEEWKNESGEEGRLDESISGQIIQAVVENTHKPDVKYRVFKYCAAACIAALVIVGASYFSFFNEREEQKQAVVVKKKDVQIVKQENNGTKDIRLTLPDRSVVLLHPRSSIAYDAACFKSIDTSVRDVFLTGSAFFKVAKNPRKPFTVYSGGLSTVALGTEFDVLKNNQNTTVKLYKGKVAVNVLVPNRNWTKKVVLLPGQMVSLNDGVPKKIKEVVLKVRVKDSVTVRKKKGNIIRLHTQSFPLQCDNMLLEDVIKTLEQYYRVNISYDKGLLKNKYFSGEILPDTSPEPILRLICNMQDLIVEKKGSGYLIHK